MITNWYKQHFPGTSVMSPFRLLFISQYIRLLINKPHLWWREDFIRNKIYVKSHWYLAWQSCQARPKSPASSTWFGSYPLVSSKWSEVALMISLLSFSTRPPWSVRLATCLAVEHTCLWMHVSSSSFSISRNAAKYETPTSAKICCKDVLDWHWVASLFNLFKN